MGTGIERMIAACHASGLPTPVFEYHGSAFVVTILKDAWTRTALESLDLNPDQIKAVSYVKVNGWISSSRYAELYKVPMRTSSRELGELAHKGVFVLVGKGRQSRYELKSNRARIAPIAPNCTQGQKPPKNKEKQDSMRKLSPQTSKETTLETAQETSKETCVTSKEIWHLPDDLSDAARVIAVTLLQNPTWTAKDVAKHLGLTQQGVQYHIARLAHILHHEGPTKKGRWVFGPNPKGNRHEK